MENISSAEYHRIVNHPENIVIYADTPEKPRILLNQDGIILKVFYPRTKLFSFNHLYPQALRFARHANILLARGHLAPTVVKLQYFREKKIHVLHYHNIEGQDVLTLINQGHSLSLMSEVASYLATLHQDGVFFRGIHLRNIIYTEQEKFALVDISDAKFKSKSLSLHYRYRNLRHLFAAQKDQVIWQQFGKENFLNVYLQHAKLSSFAKKILKYHLMKKIMGK